MIQFKSAQVKPTEVESTRVALN